MTALKPSSPEDLAEQLKIATLAGRTIHLFGSGSKILAGGPVLDADVQISTESLNRILAHERNDLTISVESGVRLSAVQNFLQSYDQMLALDPPCFEDCTVGGVIATDLNGPLRRRFGSVRDQVIGMTFATLDGRLVKAGGMVVKNVAGLDLAKLMIGSFGTLAGLTSVNLRVHTRPKLIQTFLSSFKNIESATEKRNELLRSTLNPWAIELFSAPAAARLGRRGILLAVRAAGSSVVLDRYAKELKPDEIVSADEDVVLWRSISNFSSDFMARNPSGMVVRLGTPISEIITIFRSGSGSYVAHAGSGTTDAYFTSWQPVPTLWSLARQKGWEAVIAFAAPGFRLERELWLRSAESDRCHGFDMMVKLKQVFDPGNLLNRSRLYGCV